MKNCRAIVLYLVPASIFISADVLFRIACAIESLSTVVVKKAQNEFMHAVDEFFDRSGEGGPGI